MGSPPGVSDFIRKGTTAGESFFARPRPIVYFVGRERADV